MADSTAERVRELLLQNNLNPGENAGQRFSIDMLASMVQLLTGIDQMSLAKDAKSGKPWREAADDAAKKRKKQIEKNMITERAQLPLDQQKASTLIEEVKQSRERFSDMHEKSKNGKSQVAVFSKQMVLANNCGNTDVFNFATLLKVPIRDLFTMKQNEGSYILFRVIAAPDFRIAVVVADPSGTSIIADFDNQPILPITLGLPSFNDIKATFPLNAVFALKEPTLSVQDAPIRKIAVRIRVDSPTDLVRLYPDDPQVRGVKWSEVDGLEQWRWPIEMGMSLDEWKAKGDKFHLCRRFIDAIETYTTALRQCETNPKRYLLFLNRSACNISLERFGDAYCDATQAEACLLDALQTCSEAAAIDLKQRLGKARLRIAKSYYGSRRWRDAGKAYLICLKGDQGMKEAAEGLKLVQCRIREAEQGKYDWLDMYNQSQKPKARIAVADWFGPVEVDDSYGKERGLFLDKNVRAGDLLVVSKGIDVIYPDDIAIGEKVYTYDLDTQTIDLHSGARLRRAMVYRMFYDPTIVAEVEKLDSGPGRSIPDIGLSPAKNNTKSKIPSSGSTPIDIARLDDVIKYNAFLMDPLLGGSFKEMAEGGMKKQQERGELGGGGLWVGPNFINHGCASNCSSITIGDVTVVKAAEDMAKGTELTIAYNFDKESYQARRQDLLRYFRSACGCQLCIEDRLDGEERTDQRDDLIAQRLVHMAQLHAKILLGEGTIPAVEARLESLDKIIEGLAATLGKLPFIRITTSLLRNLYIKAIRSIKDSLESVGVILKARNGSTVVSHSPANVCVATVPKVARTYVIKGMLQIAGLYGWLGNREQEISWIQAAYWTDQVIAPKSLKLFWQRYDAILENLDLQALKAVRC